MLGPNLKNMYGMGAMATAKKPRIEVDQADPNVSYIWRAKSGKAAPKSARRMAFAASALAEYRP